MKRLQIGDVFVIPTGDGRGGLGQIVATYLKKSYYFVMLDWIVSEDPSEEEIAKAMSGQVLLLALSFDAKLRAGHWKIVGHAPVDPKIPLPAYKEAVGTPWTFEIVDYSGSRRRSARLDEADSIPNRSIVSAAVLEKALRAHLGLEPWHEAYDELRPEGRPTTAELFG